jgi:ubiquinone/menaquinone biosynthesis C-methylase UbiE
MATKSLASNETGLIFASREAAEQWQCGKAHRAEVTGPANEMMLDLANLRAGDRVLDLAAGTGDQTLMAARRVGPTGYVLATDISASMLEIAREAVRNAGLTNVETRVMDAEKIDLDPDSFDAVICRMGLMLFSNPVKALIGMRRVVKPTGKVVALVLSTEQKNPYLGVPLAIVRRLGRTPSPAKGDRGTFALGGPGVLEDTYRRAGFLDVTVHAVSIRRRFQSVAEAVQTMKDLFSPFFLQELMATLGDAEREQAWAQIERQLGQFGSPNGFEIPGEALVAVGTK